jgi:hypothetical protein
MRNSYIENNGISSTLTLLGTWLISAALGRGRIAKVVPYTKAAV